MRYEQRMRKYWQKKLEDPLPKLPEDERIYLNVPYMARDFAKYSHCGFDPERKLWFTGSLNRKLRSVPEVTRWSFKKRFSVYTGGDGGTEN